MAYELLGKLYYKDQTLYAQTYKSRFEDKDTVKLNFTVSKKQAFFVQSNEIYKLAYDIAKLDKAVTQLSMKLPGIAREQYSKKCLIDEIVLTNKIEGVHSSRKEIAEALDILNKQSNEKGKQQRFVGMVNRYFRLLYHEEIPLSTCQDIRRVYDEIVLDEVLAENPKNVPDGMLFRKDQSSVYNEAEKEIHKGAYPESDIIASMEKALAFFNDSSVEKLFRVCVFHYLLEYIHPFYDGNGRLGRFILSYSLSDILDPLLSYRLSETIKENIADYYKAFKICNEPKNLGDLTPFLVMLLKMIYNSLEHLRTSLEQKLISLNKYHSLIEELAPNEAKVLNMYSCLIQAALFSEGGISTKELMSVSDESYYTVKKTLNKINADMLVVKNSGSTKLYQLDLSVLDNYILDRELKKAEQ